MLVVYFFSMTMQWPNMSRNAVECRLSGPSSLLPAASDLLDLIVLPGEKLFISCSDRKDCLMSILNKAFRLVGPDYVASSEPKLISLPLAVAEELTLLAVLMPLIQSDLAAPMCKKIYATDASKDRGAIVQADSRGYASEILHRACKSKGSYTKLAPRESMVLREVDDDVWDNGVSDTSAVHRPIAFKFQFLEVFAGSSKVSEWVSKNGFVVGPPLDLSWSTEYDLRWPHVMSWISFMFCEGRLLSVLIEPPCTTFSILRRPALRDKAFPFGYNPADPQTEVGNTLALRGLQTLQLARSYGAAAVLETPNSSKLKNLPSWKTVEKKENAYAIRCDSCRFGSSHLKSFKF